MKIRAMALVMALVFPVGALAQTPAIPAPKVTPEPGEKIPVPENTPAPTKAPKKKSTKKGTAKPKRTKTPVPTPAAK